MPRAHRILRLGLTAVTVAGGLLAVDTASAPTSARAATTTLTSCDESALRTAVGKGGTVRFGVSCAPLTLTSTIVVPKGLSVTIDATGFSVALDGRNAVRLFDVSGGTLTVRALTLQHGRAAGISGAAGAAPAAAAAGGPGSDGPFPSIIGCEGPFGSTGKAGSPGKPGKVGGAGLAGGAGTPGGNADGGALRITAGTVTLESVTVVANSAIAGNGGAGGVGARGGAGGAGGTGSDGGQGTVDLLTGRKCTTGGPGGQGGDGQNGGTGGAGGPGSSGGTARGGAIFNQGSLTVTASVINSNVATGGTGGNGGAGGAGGVGGRGGNGGSGGAGATGGDGGKGGDGAKAGGSGIGGAAGAGGSGGAAGAAIGGAIYNEGTLRLTDSTLADDNAVAGPGGYGGAGGHAFEESVPVPIGGTGGYGGDGSPGAKAPNPGGVAANGGNGVDGGAAGAGGKAAPGAAAEGGAIANRGRVTVVGGSVQGSATGGAGGGGGTSGRAGPGGLGGPGGGGGYGSAMGGSGGAGGAAGRNGRQGAAVIGGASAPGGDATGGGVANRGSLVLRPGTGVTGQAIGGAGGTGGFGSTSGQFNAAVHSSSGEAGHATEGTKPGSPGGAGAVGGAAGGPGARTAGGPGAPGSAAGSARGGGIANLGRSATLRAVDVRLGGSATGGTAGNGGGGGLGGGSANGVQGLNDGGSGGTPSGGGPGAAGDGDISPGDGGAGGDGTDGSNAAPGAVGGTGGSGSTGGAAYGGSLYNDATMFVFRSSVSGGRVYGGPGGNGGAGGAGGNGGTAGSGSGGSNAGASGGPGGNGAAGGKPGAAGQSGAGADGGGGGNGGNGGSAQGGGLYLSGSAWRLEQATITDNRATGGRGGQGSVGGDGGIGGGGGNGGGAGQQTLTDQGGVDGASGTSGGRGGDAGSTGSNAAGGAATGGGIAATAKGVSYLANVFGTTNGAFAERASITSCAARPSSPCNAPGGVGGPGGYGGGGSQSTVAPTEAVPNPPPGKGSGNGSGGTAGAARGDSSPGSVGAASYPDATPPVLGTGFTVPDQPVIYNVYRATGALQVYWRAPMNTGARPITGYTSTLYKNRVAQKSVDVEASGLLSASFDGLSPGTAYSFRVAATNSVGTGPKSGFSPPASPKPTGLGRPDAPKITGVSVGDGQVGLSWSVPASDGGSPIYGYRIRVITDGPPREDYRYTTDERQTSMVITGLTNGKVYAFYVNATNDNGEGTPSDFTRSVTPTAGAGRAPSSPTVLSQTPGDGRITVTIAPPTDDGGRPVTGYLVNLRWGNGSGLTPVRFTGASRTLTLTGLENGVDYLYSVAAVNSIGVGDESGVTDAVRPLPYLPFVEWSEFVTPVFTDLHGRAPTPTELAAATDSLTFERLSKGGYLASLRASADNTKYVDPAVRLARIALAPIPAYADLTGGIATLRRGTSLTALATSWLATSASKARLGTKVNKRFVELAYTYALGRSGAAKDIAAMTKRLDTRKATRGAVLAGISEAAASRAAQAKAVTVIALRELLLHAAPAAAVVAADVASLAKLVVSQYAQTLTVTPQFVALAP